MSLLPTSQGQSNDLSLDPLQVEPASPKMGQRLTVATVLHNEGPELTQVRVEGRVNNWLVLNTTYDLAANSSTPLTFDFKLNYTTTVITVVVDPNQQYNDTNRSNNIQSYVIGLETEENGRGLAWLAVGLVVLGGGTATYLYVRRQTISGGPGQEAP